MVRPASKGLSMAEPTKYLEEYSVADLLSVSVRTIQRWRGTGEGPPFTGAGARRGIYDPAHVNAWAAARTFKHLGRPCDPWPRQSNPGQGGGRVRGLFAWQRTSW